MNRKNPISALLLLLLPGAVALAQEAEKWEKPVPEIRIERTAGAALKGVVIAAPHEGYDVGTGSLAEELGDSFRCGLVIASNYRKTRLERWFDVNRPTERPFENGKPQERIETDRARRIYEQYQDAVYTAARVETGPIDLLVELHGHSRSVMLEGESVRLEVIELATQGFTEEQLQQLAQLYERLVSRLPHDERVPLAIDRLDPTYEYEGETVPFYFRATSARELGSMRPGCARKALHFELPRRARGKKPAKRYAELIAELMREVVRSDRKDEK